MHFHELIRDLVKKDLGRSLGAFQPELALCATIVALLLAAMIVPRWKSSAFYVMLVGSAAALLLAIPWQPPDYEGPLFTGLLVFDTFSIYMRCLLLLFVLLFATFTQVAGVPDREDATEFYVLVLGATLGMCLMVSANHMLIVFLGIEMASVPSYVLAGLLRHRRQSSEAALKYAVFGAATAGVMLYGISLLVGTLGSAHLPTMAVQLAAALQDGMSGDQAVVLMLAGLMLMVGLAFKLSAVPFHFWAPDVFEGATVEVAAFLSVASKAAALALLVRLALGFAYVDSAQELAYRQRNPIIYDRPIVEDAGHPNEVDPAAQSFQGSPSFQGSLSRPDDPQTLLRNFVSRPQPQRPLSAALKQAREYIVGLIALLAAVTCTFGNLAAYGQTNMKRLLAYSTIAHAGYMMMPVAAAVALAGRDSQGAQKAVAALAFYLGIYLFMNLGAFAVVAFLRNELHSESIADYAGLIRKSPGLAVCMSIILFSLVGLPPLAGFAAKFAVFAALADAGSGLLALLVIAGLNTVLSLFYYLRVVKVMVLAPPPEDRPAPEIPLGSIPGTYCAALTLPVLVLGVWWGGLFDWAEAAAAAFLF